MDSTRMTPDQPAASEDRLKPNTRYPVFPIVTTGDLDEYGNSVASIDIDFCDGDCILGPHERGRHYNEFAEITIFHDQTR